MAAHRITLIHATAVSMAPTAGAFGELWPEAETANLLDDSLSTDLAAAAETTPALTRRLAAPSPPRAPPGLAPRTAPRIRRPVLVYGLLELGIALSALAVPLGMRALTAAYVALFGGGEVTEPGALATVFRLGGAFLLMLTPTA